MLSKTIYRQLTYFLLFRRSKSLESPVPPRLGTSELFAGLIPLRSRLSRKSGVLEGSRRGRSRVHGHTMGPQDTVGDLLPLCRHHVYSKLGYWEKNGAREDRKGRSLTTSVRRKEGGVILWSDVPRPYFSGVVFRVVR